MVRTKSEHVSGHKRRDIKGDWVPVHPFSRRPKFKRIKSIKKARINYMHRRDDQGRFAYR